MPEKKEWQILAQVQVCVDLGLCSFPAPRPLERENYDTVSTNRPGSKENAHCTLYQLCFSSVNKNNRSLRALLMFFVQEFMPVCAGGCRSIILERLKQLASLSQGKFPAEQIGADSGNLHLALHSNLLPHVHCKATVKPKANRAFK